MLAYFQLMPLRRFLTPGCVRVFTYEDIPGRNRLGIINKDQYLLAEDKIRFVGDPVALVAAETYESAHTALASIHVDYEDLPAILDPEEALRPGAIKIHENGNLLGRRVIKRGSPEAAFKQADVVVERIYTTSYVEHTYLEPDSGMAYLDDDGILVIHASTQNPHYDQKDVADLLRFGREEGSGNSGCHGRRFRLKTRSKRPRICRIGGLPSQKTR